MGRLGAVGRLTGVYWYTQKQSAHHLGTEVEIHSSIHLTKILNIVDFNDLPNIFNDFPNDDINGAVNLNSSYAISSIFSWSLLLYLQNWRQKFLLIHFDEEKKISQYYDLNFFFKLALFKIYKKESFVLSLFLTRSPQISDQNKSRGQRTGRTGQNNLWYCR